MKTIYQNSVGGLFALLYLVIFLGGCKTNDVLPQIDPLTQPSELSKALKIKGSNKSGDFPTLTLNQNLKIQNAMQTASVTVENSLYIPFVFRFDGSSNVAGIQLKVVGADNYWEIPISKSSTNNKVDSYVVEVGIPKNILNGKFAISYRLYDQARNVSKAVDLATEIVPTTEFCAMGGSSLGKVVGQDGLSVRSFRLGNKPGWITISYNTYSVKDRIDVKFGDNWIRSTGALLTKNSTPPTGLCSAVGNSDGFVGARGEFNIYYDPKIDDKIDVYVSGCLDGGTQWEYVITDCPSERAILGIHSSEPVTNCSIIPDCNNWGHAWISVTDNGKTTYYGLWPDSHDEVKKRGLDNGTGSDVRINIEGGSGQHNRYIPITKTQLATLESLIKRNFKYNFLTFNCSSFASYAYNTVTGEKINAQGLSMIDSPCKVSESIEALNRTKPTEVNYNPIGIRYSSFNRIFCD